MLLHALFFSVLFYDWQTTSKPVGPDASMIDISGIAVSTAPPPQTSSVMKKTSRLDRHKLHHSVIPRLQKQKKITHQHPENRAIDKHLSTQQAKAKPGAIEKRRAQQQAKKTSRKLHHSEKSSRRKIDKHLYTGKSKNAEPNSRRKKRQSKNAEPNSNQKKRQPKNAGPNSKRKKRQHLLQRRKRRYRDSINCFYLKSEQSMRN